MRGRYWAALLCMLLLLALGWQAQRGFHRLAASGVLARAEVELLATARRGRGPLAVLQANTFNLEQAARWDPLEVGIPLTLGSYQLLMRNTESAYHSYQAALALEPRPELYLNLGRALRALNRLDEAQGMTDLALKLNPYLAPDKRPR